MGEPSSLTPWKKRKTEKEYSLWLICQEKSTVKVIKIPNNESLKKLLSLSREQAEYGDTKVFEFVERNENLCAEDLLNNKACYHKKCYSEFTNIEKRNRTIQRYTDALEQGQVTIVKRKAGRPSSNTLAIENEVRQLQSQSIQYNKSICINCQSPSGTTHRLETLETGKLMFPVANKISNKDFFFRLNSVLNPEDGVANDARYYLSCWVKAKKEAQRIERVYYDR